MPARQLQRMEFVRKFVLKAIYNIKPCAGMPPAAPSMVKWCTFQKHLVKLFSRLKHFVVHQKHPLEPLATPTAPLDLLKAPF